MSAPVDVLAAFDCDIQVERLIGDERAVKKVRELRAAVAELIDAAKEVERDAATLGLTTARLTAALARCGAAS